MLHLTINGLFINNEIGFVAKTVRETTALTALILCVNKDTSNLNLNVITESKK